VTNSKESSPGAKDRPTVTPAGKRIRTMISGVEFREAITHPDDRGELCEIFNPVWGIVPEPMVYAYMSTVRPGKIKGWVYHKEQVDRIFIASGHLRVVLYDLREESPTHGTINEFFITERNRALITFPIRVAHAIQNIGSTDGLFINLPTRPYNHENPDKYRIPVDDGIIPYKFPA
jgi:dTDP-4-dehydrorhamnose 3,5-epimerase